VADPRTTLFPCSRAHFLRLSDAPLPGRSRCAVGRKSDSHRGRASPWLGKRPTQSRSKRGGVAPGGLPRGPPLPTLGRGDSNSGTVPLAARLPLRCRAARAGVLGAAPPLPEACGPLSRRGPTIAVDTFPPRVSELGWEAPSGDSRGLRGAPELKGTAWADKRGRGSARVSQRRWPRRVAPPYVTTSACPR